MHEEIITYYLCKKCTFSTWDMDEMRDHCLLGWKQGHRSGTVNRKVVVEA